MQKHDPKTCPRCGRAFECKPADVPNCQCGTVELDNATRTVLAERYRDCLCADCLRAVKQEILTQRD